MSVVIPTYRVAYSRGDRQGYGGDALRVCREDLEAVIRTLVFNRCPSFFVDLVDAEAGERTVEMTVVA